MKKDKKIEVKGLEISLFRKSQDDYICLTDMARYKNPKETALVIAHWLRTGYTIEFIGIWEQLNNPFFNTTEFGSIKNQSISNSFILTTSQWVDFVATKIYYVTTVVIVSITIVKSFTRSMWQKLLKNL